MRSRPPISPLTRRERGRRTSLSVIGCSTSVSRPVDGELGEADVAQLGAAIWRPRRERRFYSSVRAFMKFLQSDCLRGDAANALEQAARNQLKSIAAQKIKDLKII